MRLHQLSTSTRPRVQTNNQLAVRDSTEPLKRVSPSSVLALPASLRLTRRRRTSSGFPSDTVVPSVNVIQPSGFDFPLDPPLAALIAQVRSLPSTVRSSNDSEQDTNGDESEILAIDSLSYWQVLTRMGQRVKEFFTLATKKSTETARRMELRRKRDKMAQESIEWEAEIASSEATAMPQGQAEASGSL